jgi:hypothetical protein
MHPSGDKSHLDDLRARSDVERMRLMPKHERDPDDDTAIETALSECCVVLEQKLAGLPHDSPRQAVLNAIQPSLGRFATITAERDVVPERMIVMLKRSVRDLRALRNWLATEREALSHELVQRAIETYYNGSGDGKGGH